MRYVQSGSCNLSALFLPLEDQTWNCRTSASGRYRRMPIRSCTVQGAYLFKTSDSLGCRIRKFVTRPVMTIFSLKRKGSSGKPFYTALTYLLSIALMTVQVEIRRRRRHTHLGAPATNPRLVLGPATNPRLGLLRRRRSTIADLVTVMRACEHPKSMSTKPICQPDLPSCSRPVN